jgi:hypothetical protein
VVGEGSVVERYMPSAAGPLVTLPVLALNTPINSRLYAVIHVPPSFAFHFILFRLSVGS